MPKKKTTVNALVSGDQLIDAFGLMDGETLEVAAQLTRFGLTFKGIMASKDGVLFIIEGTPYHLQQLKQRKCDL